MLFQTHCCSAHTLADGGDVPLWQDGVGHILAKGGCSLKSPRVTQFNN